MGEWRSLPVGYLKAGEIVYRLRPGGAATCVNDRRPGVPPVTWPQDGLRVTIWDHAADSSTGEYRFILSPDGKTLRQTDEIAYPSLSERLQHWDFFTDDTALPIPFRKETP